MLPDETSVSKNVVWAELTNLMPIKGVDYWENEMTGRGYLTYGTGMVNKSLLGQTGTAKVQRDDLVKRTIVKFIYEFAYNPDESSDIYYRKAGSKDPFVRIPTDIKELKKIVVRLYDYFFHITPSAEIEACTKNIMNNIMEQAELDNGLWYVCENTFWDSANTELIPCSGLKERNAYKEIGGTSRLKGLEPELVKRSFDRWTDILYDHGEQEFGEFYKDLPMEFDWIKLWACPDTMGFVDRYWDMCVAISTIFMYKQPPIAYLLRGKARGGKSTFVKHLHFMVGDWQTTDFQLSGLADWSFNNALFGSLLNAPDEDKAETLTPAVTTAFKSLAAKEPYTVKVKHSARSKKIIPRFMMFIPKNSNPAFGADAEPCMKRMRFIFFNNDLSRLDKKPKDFVKETFVEHPEVLAEYMGFILALSKYFSEHEMWYSETMQSNSDYIAETVNSTKLYYNLWKQFYVGFESYELLWQDYLNFCHTRGYDTETKEALREMFFMEGQNREKIYYPGTKERFWAYVGCTKYTSAVYKSGKLVQCRGEHIDGYSTAENDVINGSLSYVDIRGKLMEEAMVNWKKEENKQGNLL